MHVLQVTPRYFPNIGGVEILVQKISEGLVASCIKARVSVYSIDFKHGLERVENVNGVIVKRFTPLLSDPFYIPEPKFVASMRREKPDIIHVHNIHTFLPFLTVLSMRNRRLLLQPHYHRFGQSSFRHSLFRLYSHGLREVVLPYANMIIANSTYEKKTILEDFPTCRSVDLIPEGIDLAEVKCVEHDPVEPKRILYIGALRGYKNVDNVLKGFSYLVNEESRQFRLVIVGEGPERDSLVNMARRLDVDSFVEWKHNLSREQLLQEYAEAGVLVLLSPLESFSRVVYEALLIGVPTVILNFGALAHLVKAGLAEGVNSLEPKEIADALSKAAKKTYRKISGTMNLFLDWKDYVNRVVAVYHRLLEDR